jgi:hypothetical protein
VDDIFLIGNDIPMLEAAKTSLKNSFPMKDFDEAAYILGIKIYRDKSKRLIGLSQDTYIDKVLKRFNMKEAKKGFLPMSHDILQQKPPFCHTYLATNSICVAGRPTHDGAPRPPRL